MTFGIISGELFIVEKIASETCQRHPRGVSVHILKDFRMAIKIRSLAG